MTGWSLCDRPGSRAGLGNRLCTEGGFMGEGHDKDNLAPDHPQRRGRSRASPCTSRRSQPHLAHKTKATSSWRWRHVMENMGSLRAGRTSQDTEHVTSSDLRGHQETPALSQRPDSATQRARQVVRW